MTLFESAGANIHLRYVDDLNGKVYSIHELPFINPASKKKELAFLYLDNSISSITVFWSFMRSRDCIALLSPSISGHFKTELEKLYRPKYIYDPTRNEIADYELISQSSINYFCNTLETDTIIHEKIKILISTSGTTGSPKFVKLSEKNLLSNALSIIDYLPITHSDVTPLNLPVYYSYGLSILTTNSIKGGKIICTNDDVLKKDFWINMEKFGYTSIAGVPFVYEMLDRIGFTKKIYPSLRYFTQAGGKLQKPLVSKYADYANETGVGFYVMYGQTEATARMSFLPPKNIKEKLDSIGIPIRNGKFEIDAETNELCYKGPNIFGGYVEKPADISTYEQPAMLRTGDISYVDKDGFYYITGRLKRFTKLFGNRINLDEVESLISKNLNLIGKCVGIEDKQMLVFINDNQADLKAAGQYLSHELKLHISALKVIYAPDIPLTSNGKVDYNKLIELYGTK